MMSRDPQGEEVGSGWGKEGAKRVGQGGVGVYLSAGGM